MRLHPRRLLPAALAAVAVLLVVVGTRRVSRELNPRLEVEFQFVQKEMTYEEVCAILGRPRLTFSWTLGQIEMLDAEWSDGESTVWVFFHKRQGRMVVNYK